MYKFKSMYKDKVKATCHISYVDKFKEMLEKFNKWINVIQIWR